MSERKARGPYANGAARREEILEQAERAFARLGYRAASMREIAAECGITQTGLLHHFPSKEHLLFAVVERRNAEQEQRSAEADVSKWQEFALEVLEDNLQNTVLTQLFANLAAEAADPTHPAHDFFVQRFRRTNANFSTWFAAADGRNEPNDEDRIKAHLLAAMWDGLQEQALIDPELDLRPAFRYALAMLSRYSQYK